MTRFHQPSQTLFPKGFTASPNSTSSWETNVKAWDEPEGFSRFQTLHHFTNDRVGAGKGEPTSQDPMRQRFYSHGWLLQSIKRRKTHLITHWYFSPVCFENPETNGHRFPRYTGLPVDTSMSLVHRAPDSWLIEMAAWPMATSVCCMLMR